MQHQNEAEDGRLTKLIFPCLFASKLDPQLTNLVHAVTTPVALFATVVGIVVGFVMLCLVHGERARIVSQVILGVATAIGMVNLLAWLFPP